MFDKRPVAVKRMNKTHVDMANKEMTHLLCYDKNPNIITFYGWEQNRDFVFLALERCVCSLGDLIERYSPKKRGIKRTDDKQLFKIFGTKKQFKLWDKNDHPSNLLLKLMRDIVNGLDYLHKKKVVHRDLKPQNILINKDGTSTVAKICDMGISKVLKAGKSSLTMTATGRGSSGWRAPERLRDEPETQAVDLFSLGCLLFYCTSGGYHPFGAEFVRDGNISKNKAADLVLIDKLPEATELISQLLNHDPNLRPTAAKVLTHPLFWDFEKRLSFLRVVSDYIHSELPPATLTTELEKIKYLVYTALWDTKLDACIKIDVRNFIYYKYSSLRDLLRVIRNLSNHIGEYSTSTKAIMGQGTPEGIVTYFSTLFPTLLMEVYKTVRSHAANKQVFQRFFK